MNSMKSQQLMPVNVNFYERETIKTKGVPVKISLNELTKKTWMFQSFGCFVKRASLQTVFHPCASLTVDNDKQRELALKHIVDILKEPDQSSDTSDIIQNSTVALHIALECLFDSFPQNTKETFHYSSGTFQKAVELITTAYEYAVIHVTEENLDDCANFYNTNYILSCLQKIGTKITLQLENPANKVEDLEIFKRRFKIIQDVTQTVKSHRLSKITSEEDEMKE